MKKILAIAIHVCCVFATQAQPGQFAGNKKALIHTQYKDGKHIPGLDEWEPVQGSVISAIGDSVTTMVDVFKKGSSFVVLFSKCIDSTCGESAILDVLEITLTKGWTIKAAFCLRDDVENPQIVALAKQTKTEYLKTIKKAWLFNFETSQLEQVPVKGISCMNEEFDMH